MSVFFARSLRAKQCSACTSGDSWAWMRGRIGLFLLVILALLILGSGLGLRDPWPADEPRFALIARTMLETGHWLLPRRGETLYADKPPMFMWALAGAYRTVGSWRLAFLLPSLLAGLGTLILTYDLARRLWNRRVGLLAGLTLLTLVQFTLQAKTAQIDGLLCFWTTLGLYGLLRHLLLGPDWRWYTAGFFAMGLGIITKGVGFLPAFVLIPYAWAAWRGRTPYSLNSSATRWALGPLALVTGVAVWAVPMLIEVFSSNAPELQAYRQDLLVHQTVQRYANAWHHVHGFFFFLPQALWLWAPLTVFLPWLLPAWLRRFKRGDLRYGVLLAWIVMVMLFFSFSPGKRGVYILPAAPALAMVTAPLLAGLWKQHSAQMTARVVVLILSVLAALGALALGFTPLGGHFKMSGAGLSQEHRWLLAAGFAALSLVGFGLQWKMGTRRAMLALAGLIWSLWLALGWIGFPVLNPIRSTAPFMAEVGQRIGPDAELAIADWKEQYLLFADRPVSEFGYHGAKKSQSREAAAWLSAGGNRWLLVNKRNLERTCVRAADAIDIGSRHRDHWFLANPASLDADCMRKFSAKSDPDAGVSGSGTSPDP